MDIKPAYMDIVKATVLPNGRTLGEYVEVLDVGGLDFHRMVAKEIKHQRKMKRQATPQVVGAHIASDFVKILAAYGDMLKYPPTGVSEPNHE